MKSEEIIFMVFVGLIVVGIPFVFWMIHNDEKRKKEEEIREWQERKRKQNESLKNR